MEVKANRDERSEDAFLERKSTFAVIESPMKKVGHKTTGLETDWRLNNPKIWR